ncbi:PPE domain-containing protein [Nocardia brevicatena]|uniref:PPE domain-containing protein n=1 Tax=Nocardia brevicatena TaxID=37327 RepID=UPI0005936F45|nr:PPE domain-containing protein [Nocardia brevicatena]
MALDIDLGEQAAGAVQISELVRNTGAALPRGWALPAGTDPKSAEAVPGLNAWAEGLFNGVVGVMNNVQELAHTTGAALVRYADTDERGARMIAAVGGGHDMTNPVPAVEPLKYRRVPPHLSSMTSVTGDPLVFAQQLHSGPGPGPVHRFAESVRTFASDTVTIASGDMDRVASILRRWTPVGSEVADKLTKYRGRLDELGTGLKLLADSADAYGNAFAKAKAKHPTPEEIIAARKELVRAMRSRDEIGTQAALAKFQEQNARSAETVSSYTAEANSTEAAGATGAAGNGTGGSGSQDSSALMQMLPTLMSMMGTGMDGLSDTTDIPDDYYDDSYDDYGTDYGIPSLGSSPGTGGIPSLGGVPSVSQVEDVAVGAMPMVAGTGMATGTGLGAAPRVPVLESAAASSPGTAYGRGGSPMMPYMPMSPGMGGANGGGGGERNRVVAWHPDRLMYVDDTPHTEPVIGERPTIAPTVTSPTPPPPNQAPTRSGGTA